MIVTTRKAMQSTKICVDASDIFRIDRLNDRARLYKELAEIFRDAYRDGVLLTNDYLGLCEITLKEQPSISTKQHCDLTMTHDRVIMRLLGHVEEYEKRIRKCFEEFYLGDKYEQ